MEHERLVRTLPLRSSALPAGAIPNVLHWVQPPSEDASTPRPSVVAVSCLDSGGWLLFECCQNWTIGARKRPCGFGIQLRFGIPWSLTRSPGYFQACLPGPSSFQRLAFNKLVSIQPSLGISIDHHPLPGTPEPYSHQQPTNLQKTTKNIILNIIIPFMWYKSQYVSSHPSVETAPQSSRLHVTIGY